MEILDVFQIKEVSGGKPKVLNVVGGALFTGVIEGVIGGLTGGPPGFFIGFFHGLLDGTGGALIIEAGNELAMLSNVVVVQK